MGFFSGICSAVSSVFSAVGGAISNAMSAIAPIVGKIGSAISVVMPKVALVCQAIGLLFDLFSPQIKSMDDLGDRVLQANEEGISLKSCKTFEEYKQKIENFELDPQKSMQYSQLDKQVAATVYVAQGMQHLRPELRYEALLPIIAARSDFFTPDRVKSYINTALNTGYDMGKLAQYLDGTCAVRDREKGSEFLKRAEGEFQPGYDARAFEREITETKNAVRG